MKRLLQSFLFAGFAIGLFGSWVSCSGNGELVRTIQSNPDLDGFLYRKGYQFRIHGSGADYKEILSLEQGDFLIQFRSPRRRITGFLFCRVNERGVYSFEITGRDYLPQTGKNAFKGSCFFDRDKTRSVTGSIENED